MTSVNFAIEKTSPKRMNIKTNKISEIVNMSQIKKLLLTNNDIYRNIQHTID